jgi:hypothetical protein
LALLDLGVFPFGAKGASTWNLVLARFSYCGRKISALKFGIADPMKGKQR